MPFYIRGPNIRKNRTITKDEGFILNIDILPTLYSLGQIYNKSYEQSTQIFDFDGLNISPLLFSNTSSSSNNVLNRTSFLIEYNGEHQNNRPYYSGDNNYNLFCLTLSHKSFTTPPYYIDNTTWSSVQDVTNNTYKCTRSCDSAINTQVILFCF